MTKPEAEFAVMVEVPKTIYGLAAVEAGETLRDEVTPLMITAVPEAGRAYVVGAEPGEEIVIEPPRVRV